MGRLRTRIGWVVRGREHTANAIADVTTHMDARLARLEEAVAVLESRVRDLHDGQDALRERQLDEFDRVREAVAAATDDLAARVTALSARADEPSERT